MSPGDYTVDRPERLHYPEIQIIPHTGVPVFGPRVFPRNHEDRVPFIDEVFDERIMRREVENIIFHNPGRDDKDRLRVHVPGRRLVLDKLDKTVPEYNLAGRDCNGFPDLESFRPNRFFADYGPLPVLKQVEPPSKEVIPPGLDRFPEYFGICQYKVRGGKYIQYLAGDERDDIFMVTVNPVNPCSRIVEPLLGQEERLIHQIKRHALPSLGTEPLILGQGFYTGLRS